MRQEVTRRTPRKAREGRGAVLGRGRVFERQESADRATGVEMALRLFVWDEVAWDYRPGIAFALAEDAAHARRLIIASFYEEPLASKIRSGEHGLETPPVHEPTLLEELSAEPRVYDEPFGMLRNGGS